MNTSDWKEAALAATRGSRLGAILRCAIDEDNDGVPRFTSKASVTSDGFVMADFVDRNGSAHMGAFVGAVGDLRSNIIGLAKHLDLTGERKEAFYDAFRNWIGRDYSGKGLALP